MNKKPIESIKKWASEEVENSSVDVFVTVILVIAVMCTAVMLTYQYYGVERVEVQAPVPTVDKAADEWEVLYPATR